MKQVWKPALFVALNSFSILVSLGITGIHWDLYTGKQTDPIALLAIIPAWIILAAIGAGLLGLGERFHISMLNKLLPFVAMLGFLVALLFESEYEKSKILFGLSIGAVVCLLTAVSTAQTLVLQRRRDKLAQDNSA